MVALINQEKTRWGNVIQEVRMVGGEKDAVKTGLL